MAKPLPDLLLLCFSCPDFQRLHNQPRLVIPLLPGDDGLHRVPDVFPNRNSFPLQFDHHQLSDIDIQGHKKGVGFIPTDAFHSGRGRREKGD